MHAVVVEAAGDHRSRDRAVSSDHRKAQERLVALEVRHPQMVLVGEGIPAPLHQVRMARTARFGLSGPDAVLPADDPADPKDRPHPPDLVTAQVMALPGGLVPQLAAPVDPEVGRLDAVQGIGRIRVLQVGVADPPLS